jgi:hypothetical protein
MESKVARELGRVTASAVLEKRAKGASCPKHGNPPPPGQKPDKDIERLPEKMQGKAYKVKKKVPKPGFPKASAARELGRLVAGDQLIKRADKIVRVTFEKVATAIGKKAGLSTSDVKALIKEAFNGYGMPGMMPGYGMGGMGGGGGGGYGMPGMGYGGRPGMGYLAGGSTGGAQFHDPSQYETRGILGRVADWFGGGESPMARRAREMAKAQSFFKRAPGGGGAPGAPGAGGAGGGAPGAGGGGLYPPSVMRMAARGGWNPQQWGQQMDFARDLGIGTQARRSVGKEFRNIFGAGTGLWG